MSMRRIGWIALGGLVVMVACGPVSSTETSGQQGGDVPPPSNTELYGSEYPREYFHPQGPDPEDDDRGNDDDRDGGVSDAGDGGDGGHDGGADGGNDGGVVDNGTSDPQTNDPNQRWLLGLDGGLIRSDSGLGF